MIKRKELVQSLNKEFRIDSFGRDSAFSRFVPMVYEPVGFDWKSEFTTSFTTYFNGLMLEGAEVVNQVFLAVFPTDDVLATFISKANAGDLLFMHHPLVMECGDPKGEWGRGFVPIPKDWIAGMKEKNLSVYTCHAPMDYHKELGTSVAIARELHVNIEEWIIGDEHGEIGIIGSISSISTQRLIQKLESTFDIPYVDFEGKDHQAIEKVAIIPGCGDKVEWMKQAEAKGVQAYISGEIHCHIDNEYGNRRFQEMMKYVDETSMSLIGVSHAASEYLVKKTLIKEWFEREFSIEPILIPQSKWWL
ncbi:Nif3-like dinuclear metal center hexameric protein [Bacillus salitolerans]|uniref:GTP cyclohydrolase 1 type 2 homolog n=1 Tax=Bacillus salitolerans TaxID=1437434 RepID=A0ABW4LTH4_9BACI